MSIYLTAVIKAKPGKAEIMKAILLELVGHSSKEEACLQYELYQEEDTFIFHERWKDITGLELHNQQPHLKAFISKTADLTDGTPVIYQTERIA